MGQQLHNDRDQLISAYTRAKMIEDGVLVDVSDVASDAGFRFPVALTKVAYEDCVAWNDEDNHRKRIFNDMQGRLWDLVCMAMSASRQCRNNEILFELHRVPRSSESREPEPVQLKAIIGPGDTPSPVITIVHPKDDYDGTLLIQGV